MSHWARTWKTLFKRGERSEKNFLVRNAKRNLRELRMYSLLVPKGMPGSVRWKKERFLVNFPKDRKRELISQWTNILHQLRPRRGSKR